MKLKNQKQIANEKVFTPYFDRENENVPKTYCYGNDKTNINYNTKYFTINQILDDEQHHIIHFPEKDPYCCFFKDSLTKTFESKSKENKNHIDVVRKIAVENIKIEKETINHLNLNLLEHENIKNTNILQK